MNVTNETLLSIIIVSYNTREMTLECLQSVYDQTSGIDFEVIVYDNDSHDGSVQAIEENFPLVKLIAAKDNIGFAMGNNKAIEGASGEYVLLLNPDTLVLDKAINELMDFARARPEAGIWGGKTLFGDRSLNPGSCFRKMSVWNQFCRASGLTVIFRNSEFFNSEDYGGWARNTERSVDIVCGCFLLIKRDLWQKLGGFDRRYFMYAEEADLCLRAKALGYSPAITPKAVIVHYGGGSEKIRADKMVRLLAAKSELLHVHWSSWKRPLGRALLRSWVLSRMIALFLLSAAGGAKAEARRATLASWKEIWARSREWVNGYSGYKG